MIWELLKKTSKNSRNSLIRKKSVSKNIDNAFWQADGNWSTTTDWRRIIFVFQDGKKIIIENSDDIPNYLYTPGIINFEGLKFRSNSILFGRNIDEIMKGQFFNEVTRDKNYAILKIADYLYRKKLSYLKKGL